MFESQVSQVVATTSNEPIDILGSVPKSPDIQTSADSVLRIVGECIDKFKISTFMGKIFEKSKAINQVLTGTEYENCGQMLVKLSDTYWKFDRGLHPTCAQEIVEVIDAFQENFAIWNIIENLIYKPEDDDACFVNALESLKDIANVRFYRDANAELQLEKRLHIFYNENKLVQNDIIKFQSKIMKSKNALRWRIAAKEAIVVAIKEHVDKDQFDRDMIFRIEEKESGEHFHNAQNLMQHRSKELEEEVDRTNETLVKTLKLNHGTEQEVRGERNKLLIQLQSLIKKYDSVLGEKFKINLMLDKNLAEVQCEFDEFFKTYQIAEAHYTEIVTAIEQRKQAEFAKKLALFVGNRAARIIQSAWRRYWKAKRAESGYVPRGKGKRKK